MPQTILSFDIETTNEKLTPRAGVAIFGEYLKGMDLFGFSIAKALTRILC